MRQLFYQCPLTKTFNNEIGRDTYVSQNFVTKAIVVAFDDRAFVALDVATKNHQIQDDGATSTVVMELVAAPKTTEKATTVTEQQEQQQQQQQLEVKHDVCAVSMIRSHSASLDSYEFVCAVARSDKTLCVYHIDYNLWSKFSNSIGGSTFIPPTMSYRSPKRLTSMTFGTLPWTVPGPADRLASKAKTPVLIAADVVGDAYAYSLGRTDQQKRGQRLLLGHTASMLTGVKMTSVSLSSSPEQDFLLTSDRDEKIRISYWPETYKIHGYLLGHTEYVSAFDVAVTTTPAAATEGGSGSSIMLAVSCGGDLTIRLWNVTTKEQLCLTDIDQPSNGNEEEKQQQQQDQELNENETGDEAQSSAAAPTKVPTDISINDSGTLVAVIFDNCCEMDIYNIENTTPATSSSSSSTSSLSLSKVCSTTFPCQPLSIDFVDDKNTVLAVLQDPSYVMGYQIQHDDQEKFTLSVQTDWDRSLDTLRSYGKSLNISMPTTILEKDEWGLPKLQRKNETRGPSGSTPWNRVERVEPMKERQSRKNKNKRKRQKTKAATASTEDEAAAEAE